MFPIRVVLVEDDPMVLQVNREFIAKNPSFSVVGTASTGEEAIVCIEKHKPDLALLDIYLPDFNGVQVLQEVRRQELPTDIILVTAARDAETIQNVFRFGAIDYIIKPFKMERLQGALESYKLLHTGLKLKGNLNQEDVDSLKGQRTPLTTTTLPKGFNDVTLRQVFLYVLKGNMSMSAEDVAEGVGLARVTARRYLDYLEKEGKLVLEIQYGSIGRPVNRYKIN